MTRAQRVVLFLACVMNIALCAIGFRVAQVTRQSVRFGSMLVDLMYNFDNFEELPDKYRRLYNIVDDPTWSHIDANTQYRFAWAYSRFRGQYCHSVVTLECPGIVLYRMHTPYISPYRYWVLLYSVEDGLLSSIQEWEFTEVSSFGDGGQGIMYTGP